MDERCAPEMFLMGMSSNPTATSIGAIRDDHSHRFQSSAGMRKKRTLQDGVANEHYRVSDLSGGRLPRPVPHIECRFWAELTDRPALEKALAGV
jgi:hypothetical protein